MSVMTSPSTAFQMCVKPTANKKRPKHPSFALCQWNPPVTVGFSSHRGSYAETVFMAWCLRVVAEFALQWRYNEHDGVFIVCSTVGSRADQRKNQSSPSLVFVRGNHRWPVNSLQKKPATRKIYPFDDIIMEYSSRKLWPKKGTFPEWRKENVACLDFA